MNKRADPLLSIFNISLTIKKIICIQKRSYKFRTIYIFYVSNIPVAKKKYPFLFCFIKIRGKNNVFRLFNHFPTSCSHLEFFHLNFK